MFFDLLVPNIMPEQCCRNNKNSTQMEGKRREDMLANKWKGIKSDYNGPQSFLEHELH